MGNTSLTEGQRRLRARAAAFAQHAQGRTNTGPATIAQLARFEREVDPDGSLPPDERARRAGYARRSYMTKLALKASRARSKKKATPADVSEAGVAESEVHHHAHPTT